MKALLLCLLTLLYEAKMSACQYDAPEDTHDQIILYAQLLTAAAVGAATISAKHLIKSIPNKSQEMLLNAAATNNLRKADWLLWLGVNPNEKQNEHGFPLHNAVYYDHEPMVQLLVHHKAKDQLYDYNFACQKSALHHTARVQGQFQLDGNKARIFYKWKFPSHYSPSMLYLLLTLHKERKLETDLPAYQVYEWTLQEKLYEKADRDRKLSPEQLALQEVPLFLYLQKQIIAHQLIYADPSTYN